MPSRICPTRPRPWPGPPACPTCSRRRSPSGAATRGWPSCPGRRCWPTSRASCPTPPPRSGGSCCRPVLTVGDRTVWVHVTHLNYRLTHGRQREDQVLAIDELVASRKEIEPQILMGDFNARPESDEMRWMCGLTTLRERRTVYQDAWARLHPGDAGLDLGGGQPLHQGAELPAARTAGWTTSSSPPNGATAAAASSTAGWCSTSRRAACTPRITTACSPRCRSSPIPSTPVVA